MVAHAREQGDSRTARRLNEPERARIVAEDGVPVEENRVRVAALREESRVVDRWWTEEAVRRRYFDVVLETGENGAVFCDEVRGGWFTQRA